MLVLTLHSQAIITFHPSFLSAWSAFESLASFLLIFVNQNSVLVFGTTKYLHPLCPCQKHPCMKMAVLYLGSTISGFPGRVLSCNLYLNPRACRNRLTIISGLVFLPLICDMLKLRVALSCTSAISLS